MQKAQESFENCSAEDLMHIFQGFRQKASKEFFSAARSVLLNRKDQLFGTGQMDQEKAEKLARMFFSFASNRPRFYGVYKLYVRDDIEELLAHYEHDLIDAVPHLNADDVTRLAQALYILKSDQYENIMWRVETRINELKDDLEPYHVVNVLRSFSRSQNNRMNGEDKTFYNLEPIVLKNIDSISDRDLTHLMYAYSIRAAGNPELYAAFDKKLGQIAD